MPKIFKVIVEVEEAGLGGLVSRLQGTPGVVTFTPILDKKKTNGHAPEKAKFKGTLNAEQFLLKELKAQRKMTPKDMQAAFGNAGRAPGSYASSIHAMKQDRLVSQDNTGAYHLTKRGHDKARFVK